MTKPDASTISGDALRLDEGDAVLGKRTTIRDSGDRYANIKTSQAAPPVKATAKTKRP